MLNTEGVPLAAASVSIFDTGTNNLASIFDDDEVTPKTNPLSANSLGLVQAMVPNGKYDILVMRNGVSERINKEVFYDPTDASASSVPAGVMAPFAGSSAPSGWLLAYGQAISRTTYSDLFAAIGTTYGSGDGSTTFNLPDARGRALFGVDNMGGSAANRVTSGVSGITGTTLGATGGSEAMHQHNHGVTDPGHIHVFQTGASGGFGARGDAQGTATNNNTLSATTGITINNAGTGSSQNMPPALMANYIIKT